MFRPSYLPQYSPTVTSGLLFERNTGSHCSSKPQLFHASRLINI